MMRRTTDVETTTVVTSIRMTPEQREAIRREAAAERRSFTQQMRVVIDRYVESLESEGGA